MASGTYMGACRPGDFPRKVMGSRGVVGLPQWISYLVVPRRAYETSALRSARDRARRQA